jgi:hypothetical protein
MTEALYVGGAAGYDQLFARVTQAFIPALRDAARIGAGTAFWTSRQARVPRRERPATARDPAAK